MAGLFWLVRLDECAAACCCLEYATRLRRYFLPPAARYDVGMSLEIAHDAAEVQRLLQKRPLFRIQEFGERLGWRGLRMQHLWLSKQDGPLPPGGIIVWYETTDARFHIQINESPCGQSETHAASVIAERYGLVPTEFYEFSLGNDDQQLQVEADRLAPYLARANFKSKPWRNQLRKAQPKRFYPDGWQGWRRK